VREREPFAADGRAGGGDGDDEQRRHCTTHQAGRDWAFARVREVVTVVHPDAENVCHESDLAEAANIFDAIGDTVYLSWCLEGFAGIAAADDRLGLAAQLCGAREALLERHSKLVERPMPREVVGKPRHQAAVRPVGMSVSGKRPGQVRLLDGAGCVDGLRRAGWAGR